MEHVTLKNIYKSYGETEVVKNLDLEILDKEFVVLVGPSGCGKSTILRMIAGLEDITKGDLLINKQRMNHVSPGDRGVAMVFQDYALYPHMTVYENMAFSLTLKKEFKKVEIEKRVKEASRMLDLDEYLRRKPAALSGGQRQRVAMGRAIVKQSDVFLFDEPLSNLDAKLRSKMRAEIKRFHMLTKTTTVYVTHDQLEAMTLADRLVVMNNGVIEQAGSPIEVFEKPETKFVATFIGSPSMNLIDCVIVRDSEGLYLKDSISTFKLKITDRETWNIREGRKVVLGIRANDIFINSESGINVTTSSITMMELLGKSAYYTSNIGDNECLIEVHGNVSYKIGDSVKLSIDLKQIHLFDYDTGKTLRVSL